MLTPEQKSDLKLFIRLIETGGKPDDEFLRDSVGEIADYDLQGALEKQRDKAVARYWHRRRMMDVRAQIKG